MAGWQPASASRWGDWGRAQSISRDGNSTSLDVQLSSRGPPSHAQATGPALSPSGCAGLTGWPCVHIARGAGYWGWWAAGREGGLRALKFFCVRVFTCLYTRMYEMTAGKGASQETARACTEFRSHREAPARVKPSTHTARFVHRAPCHRPHIIMSASLHAFSMPTPKSKAYKHKQTNIHACMRTYLRTCVLTTYTDLPMFFVAGL